MNDSEFPGGREEKPYSGKGPRLYVASVEDLARFSIDESRYIYLDDTPILKELKLNREQRFAVWLTAGSAGLVGLESLTHLVARISN